MALDFPTSPTVGQQYGGYVFDGVKWKVSTTSTAPASVQPTPPTNPTVGDMWFNSTDGTMYFYYNDGNTSQWVESRAPITANGYYSPNYIINGGMDIWQRGTSITATNNNYTADQWIATPYGSGGSFTVAKGTTNAPSGFQNYMKVTPVSSTSVNLFIAKFFETQDVIQLAGKTVTLSFQYKIPVSFTSQWSSSVWYSTATDSKVWAPTSATQIGSYNVLTNSTSWTSSSVTFTVPSNATSLGIQFASTNNVVSTAEFNLTGVQLELGSAATTFRRNANSLQGELAACQRYYHSNDNTEVILRTGGFNNNYANSVAFPVTMRATATITFYSDASFAGTTGSVTAYAGASGTARAATTWWSSKYNINFYIAGNTVGEFAQFSYKAEAEL